MLEFSRPPDVLGEEPSAAQNGSVTKTCTDCGAINKEQVSICCFCDALINTEGSAAGTRARVSDSGTRASRNFAVEKDWKRELEHRVETYRTRRKRSHPNADQTALPFDAGNAGEGDSSPVSAARGKSGRLAATTHPAQLAFYETQIKDSAEAAEEFAFAIGIAPRPHSDRDNSAKTGTYRVEIDLTEPPLPSSDANVGKSETHAQRAHSASRIGSDYFPLASLYDRCLAGCLDSIFLLFAYGGFLTLFGSLGGHFNFSKFTAAVYAATLVLFYVQYFALFTIFGGVTPGMMLRHLELVNFEGGPASPRQLVQRSFGYMVSGATFLLGFFWALWDEDALTWQDRISNTYLTSSTAFPAVESFAEPDTAGTGQK